nr:probable pectinesterase 53 [Ipomoea batatas]GMD31550.1 probable pectinesterase 53 [Ipomoea batatas]
MPSFRPFLYTSVFLLIILLLNATMAVSHTKPMRPKENQWKQLSVNLTQVEYSEQQFMKWVRFVGSLKHSVFKAAKNKLFPSFTLTVDKNPAHGDFTSIQDAVDSLPLVNLVRVVIKVHAGVYT